MAATMLRRTDRPPMEFEVDGDISLYPPGTDEALLLNATASEIWRRLATPTAMDDLVAGLAAGYEQPPAAIEADVAAAVKVLAAHGLVVVDLARPATS